MARGWIATAAALLMIGATSAPVAAGPAYSFSGHPRQLFGAGSPAGECLYDPGSFAAVEIKRCVEGTVIHRGWQSLPRTPVIRQRPT